MIPLYLNERDSVVAHGREVPDAVVADVERHGAVGVLGAVLEGAERELVQPVELQLHLLQVVQLDQGAGGHRVDPERRERERDRVASTLHSSLFRPLPPRVARPDS